MAIKLTKNELKNQKESLKMFQRYLPTLQLKKQAAANRNPHD
ncbi:V-type ATPase, D subunit [Treponema vincentii ATCC 35580]|uniref:V-type ATPase, D subunit n=1 Tax=Treponema vincentii ATCC 35580 TaxID=596324 RepID=C8PMZ4_9SPIR|nr:V-type ATPase, D subunit [Treponema vincentii ATCC 35580]